MNVIIDTGCANIASVRFALERLGYAVEVSRDPNALNNAERLILPGVGSAAQAMTNLRQRHLMDTIQALSQPVLGICLGMQLQARHSDEGDVACLGVIDAEVKPLQADGNRLPHMGWNTLTKTSDSPLLAGINDGDYVYFVHSFAMPVGDYTLASCRYGQPFSAVVQQGNFYGCQFHPERSAAVGARILKNFMELKA